MIVLTSSEICAKFDVTEEQIDRAMRVIDCNRGEVFYQVSSQTTAETIYEVRAHRIGVVSGLSCTCAAGNPPKLANGDYAYAPRKCWHLRAARAAAFEYRQEENLQARREAEQAEMERVQQEAQAHVAREYAILAAERDAARKNAGPQDHPFTFLA